MSLSPMTHTGSCYLKRVSDYALSLAIFDSCNIYS